MSYSLARGKAAAVTRERGEVAACSLARAVSCTWAAPGQRENFTPPPRHLAPEGITIIHKICITLYYQKVRYSTFYIGISICYSTATEVEGLVRS